MSTNNSTTTLLQLPMYQHVGNNKSMLSRNIQKYQTLRLYFKTIHTLHLYSVAVV